MRFIHVFLLAIFAALPSRAQAPSQSYGSDGAKQYRACVALLKSKPEEAFESAMSWRDSGGGPPATHCLALALVELKQYSEAATRLERLAEEVSRANSPLTPDLLGQAGNAWLLAEQPARAEQVLTAALDRRPDSVDILIDRARARAAQNQWKTARLDLDLALQLEPDRGDAYALRAAAFRRLGDPAQALEDAETALSLDPDDAAALFERGMARRSTGDLRGARADWIKVRLLEPNSLLSEAAGSALEELDVKADAPARKR
jgi:tetratricopeptide (TPR) repeat protein